MCFGKTISQLRVLHAVTGIILFSPLPVLASFPIVLPELEPTDRSTPEPIDDGKDVDLKFLPIKIEKEEGKEKDELLFEAYKENYFLFFSTRKDSKFQISFKYKLFTNKDKDRKMVGDLKLPFQYSIWEKLFFGYTQKSVWDWLEDSSPFEDHNFNPEIFWCSDVSRVDENNCNALRATYDREKGEWLWSRRYYVGLEHESNGLDGPSSRNWNRAYWRGVFWKRTFAVAPKVWYVLSESKVGEDSYISDYAGNFELEVFQRIPESVAWGVILRHGSKGKSVIADISIQHRYLVPWKNEFNPHWYLQLFSGHGEDLLNYDQERTVLRLGLRFTL